MLETGENPVLCRNGKGPRERPKSDTATNKSPEQEQARHVAARSLLLGVEGDQMAAIAEEGHITEGLRETRLLTEVEHLRGSLLPDGSIPEEVLADVRTNIFTAVQEIAMPGAVTTTFQRVAHEQSEDGRRQRVIRWLGKSAIEVARSGYEFHFSEPAYKRVDVEVAEAEYSQEALRRGVAQVFISPKMSHADAPEPVAKAEHLHADDAVRVSFPVINSAGEVIGRRLQSLLVSDIPLAAWTSMLRDPNNIFGRSFELQDESSALTVMELFEQLELPAEAVTEGPVTLVQAVQPYIADEKARGSVSRQIDWFRHDQELYVREAEKTAEEWLAFDIELARSLQREAATPAVASFIATLQHNWNADDLEVISSHDAGGQYFMTTRLAALLEERKQNILNGRAAILTNNEKVLGQMDTMTVQRIRFDVAFLELARENNATPDEIAAMQARLTRSIARQNLTVGGGCAGENKGKFEDDGFDQLDRDLYGDHPEDEGASESSLHWKWKRGVCRVEACGSPKPTEVGPCDVCRNCQTMFDRGKDPTKVGKMAGSVVGRAEKGTKTDAAPLFSGLIYSTKEQKKTENTHKSPSLAAV